MKLRLTLVVMAALGAALLVGPAAAPARTTATSATSFANIPVAGKAKNGKAFTGRYTISGFVSRKGKAYALGTLHGTLGNRPVRRNAVLVPVHQATNTGAQAAATCEILNLTLGPLDLNLLGLRVQLNQVNLHITAISGPGNLLGNLLCSVTHLLDNNPLTGTQLSQVLNLVQTLLQNIGLLNL